VNGVTATTATWVTELQDALGADSILLDPDVTVTYARDQAMLAPAGIPAAVVLPRSTAEVVAVMKVATRHGVPVVPRGAGSGLAGASNAVDGAITLVMTRMDAVLEVAPADRLAVVQPGVVNKTLRDAVAGSGLFYPPDPSSYDWCTIGGNLSTNSGGLCCVKYGVTTDYVLGLEVVLADGRVLRTGRRTSRAWPATTWRGCSSARRARSASSPRPRSRCGRRRSGRSPWSPRSVRRRRPARSSSGW
jgi:FAD/FMN-containing dehydrogenase